MGKYIDMTGNVYGKLTVLNQVENTKSAHLKWLCSCECGNNKEILGYDLRYGKTKSCGCKLLETKTAYKHGGKGTKTYEVWKNMRQRCNNPKNPQYINYGGRGIKICDRWNNYENFLEDMGETSEGLSIDRIDNDKGYSPDNCRWATRKEQNRNQRKNIHVTINGVTKLLVEWVEAGVMSYSQYFNKLRRHI
jgi:hypothetical protein